MSKILAKYPIKVLETKVFEISNNINYKKVLENTFIDKEENLQAHKILVYKRNLDAELKKVGEEEEIETTKTNTDLVTIELNKYATGKSISYEQLANDKNIIASSVKALNNAYNKALYNSILDAMVSQSKDYTYNAKSKLINFQILKNAENKAPVGKNNSLKTNNDNKLMLFMPSVLLSYIQSQDTDLTKKQILNEYEVVELHGVEDKPDGTIDCYFVAKDAIALKSGFKKLEVEVNKKNQIEDMYFSAFLAAYINDDTGVIKITTKKPVDELEELEEE